MKIERLITGVGLALMIHRLAVERTEYNGMRGENECVTSPFARNECRNGKYGGTTTGEYMVILDRIEKGQSP